MLESKMRTTAKSSTSRSTFLAMAVMSVFAAMVLAPALLAHENHDMESDEFSAILKPGQSVEVQLRMNRGARVAYSWTSTGGVVSFNVLGIPVGSRVAYTYKEGTAVAGDEGILQAQFTGIYGWLWDNRGETEVTLTLQIEGEYEGAMKMD